MTTRRRIFLAHAREDKLRVRALYDDLKACGFAPWLDEVDLMPGQIWNEEIPRAIRQAGVFLACLSSRSIGKVGYIQNEFRLALSAFGERPPGSIYLIPVRLDDCEVPDLQDPDLGLRLRAIHWVDLWEEDGFGRLVKAIEYGLATRPQAFREEVPTGDRSQQVAERRAEQETLAQAKPVEGKLSAGSEPKPGKVFRDIDEPWCPELVEIPRGKFMMGYEERPQHEVRIGHRFAVGRYPVTFEEYDRFAAVTRKLKVQQFLRVVDRLSIWTGQTGLRGLHRERPDDRGWGRGRRPVITVSWDDAKAYVAWLSEETGQLYRLLSEAEWEYACRAGTTTRYSWGDDPPTPEQANFGSNVRRTTEVGSYPANPWGLHDMHGNVLEWVEDCWNGDHGDRGALVGDVRGRGLLWGVECAPSDGSAWLTGDCSCRVLRGGCWQDAPERLRSAHRNNNYSIDVGFGVGRGFAYGFRVARTLR